MICSNINCKRIVSTFDEQCRHCGTSVAGNPAKDYIRTVDTIVDSSGLADNAAGFQQHIPGLSIPAGGSSLSSNNQSSDFNMISLLNESAYEQRLSKLKQLFILVTTNDVVSHNEEYRRKAEKTSLMYSESQSMGEVYATQNSEIHVSDGFVNFVAAIDATFRSGTVDGIKDLAGIISSNHGKFTAGDLSDYISTLDNVKENGAATFSIILAVIAHELGHICLDHIHSPGYDGQPLEVSRIQERQADSFASAIIESSVFREYLFEATLKLWLAFALIDKVFGSDTATTHPLSVERLKDTIRNQSELAREMGIDEKWVDEMLGG